MAITVDGSSNNFDALYIQVIGRFVQYKHIGHIITDHQATKGKSHFFSAA